MSLRGLPAPLKMILEQLPADSQPMDVLRTGCSALGSFEPETAAHGQLEIANRLLALFPSMLLYWHHFHASQQADRNRDGCARHRVAFFAIAARQRRRPICTSAPWTSR